MSKFYSYLVFGEKGEYSDYNWWLIACYTNREQAELHAKKAKEFVVSVTQDERYKDDDYFDREEKLRKNPYDPDCSVYLDDVEYKVYEVESVRHLDEWIELELKSNSPKEIFSA